MRKFALLLVALCLVVGMSGFAFALSHSIGLVDEFDVPLVGYSVSIWIETSQGTWLENPGYTDSEGKFYVNGTPWAGAVSWFAEVTDDDYNGETVMLQVFYPQQFILFHEDE